MSDVVAVFGDVHGQADQLQELIAVIKAKHPEAKFHSVGDLIDRGPDSKGVLDLCLHYQIEAIIGNHDQWLQNLVKKQEFDTFCLKPIMGGAATLNSYGVSVPSGKMLLEQIPVNHQDWLRELPAFRELVVAEQRYWLIHAGLTIPVANQSQGTSYQDDLAILNRVAKQSVDSILWPSPKLGSDDPMAIIKSDNLYHFHQAIQIFGHRPVIKPKIREHFIALDTGCGTCEPFTLSAVILPTKEIIQVEKRFSWM